MSVLLETSLGDIVIDLETELCPRTCENFLKLCKVYYYNLNAFFNGECGLYICDFYLHTRTFINASIARSVFPRFILAIVCGDNSETNFNSLL